MSEIKFVNKHQKWAQEILDLVGGQSNFTKHYNCMTRLRLNVVDSKTVKVEEIKSLPYVKGVVWSGQELQIIIGGEVYKLKEAMDTLVNGTIEYTNSKSELKENIEKQKRKSFKDKFLEAISGIMIPVIPILMAAGLLMGIRSLLIQTGALQNVGDEIIDASGKTTTLALGDLNWYSGLFYILAELGIGFLGIFICINTVKYLGGNTLIATFIGLAIASPFMAWIGGWTIAEFSIFSFKIQAYKNQFLPHIAGGIIYVFSDRWIKRWMPTSIDVVFRTFLAFLITTLSIFLVMGPILSIIEGLLTQAINYIGAIPFGIGAGLFALLWQPLVLTGMHAAIIIPISTTVSLDTPSPLYAVTSFAVFGQLGAALAVAIRTKNAYIAQTVYGSVPASMFGITEPILYGVNLPKITPFINGCIASGVAGTIACAMGFTSYNAGGMGLMAITRFFAGGVWAIVLFFMGLAIAIGVGLALTLLLYRERPSEIIEIKKINNKIIKMISKSNSKEELLLVKNELKKLSQFITKEHKEIIAKFEALYKKILKLDVKLNNIDSKEDEIKEILFKKYEHAEYKNKANKEELLSKFNEFNLDNKRKIILDLKATIETELVPIREELQKIQTDFIVETDNQLKLLTKSNHESLNLDKIKPMFYNAIHSVDINFDLTKKQEF